MAMTPESAAAKSAPKRVLAGDRIVLLDGGIGSEVQRRGITLDGCAWSGFSHWHHPALVQGIHSDYIQAGAQIITANSFSSAKHILERVGLGADFEAINRRAVELALRARDSAGKSDVRVAGSLSTIPPLDQPAKLPEGPEVADNYHRQARILADAGADLLIAEMLLDRTAARTLVSACLSSGLPVWAGFSASFGSDGATVMGFRAPGIYTALRDESLTEILDQVLLPGVEAAGIMHSKLPVMAPALRDLRARWDGPVMAYAETGRAGASSWSFEDVASPMHYAEQARIWIEDHGARVIGGCCGTGPEHIEALAQMIEQIS